MEGQEKLFDIKPDPEIEVDTTLPELPMNQRPEFHELYDNNDVVNHDETDETPEYIETYKRFQEAKDQEQAKLDSISDINEFISLFKEDIGVNSLDEFILSFDEIINKYIELVTKDDGLAFSRIQTAISMISRHPEIFDKLKESEAYKKYIETKEDLKNRNRQKEKDEFNRNRFY